MRLWTSVWSSVQNSTITNLQQNKAATDRHGFARSKNNPCSCLPIRGRGSVTLAAQNGPQNCTSVTSARNLSLNQGSRLPRRLALNIHYSCDLAKRGYNIHIASGIRLLDLGDMAIAETQKDPKNMTDTRYKTPIAPTSKRNGCECGNLSATPRARYRPKEGIVETYIW
jgi:hypothetical protein